MGSLHPRLAQRSQAGKGKAQRGRCKLQMESQGNLKPPALTCVPWGQPHRVHIQTVFGFLLVLCGS